jgi:hypothetical protein
MSTQQGKTGGRDWNAWARTFEAINGPEAFAALFAPGGRFADPVTPWTTDLHKVAGDGDLPRGRGKSRRADLHDGRHGH